uniref:Uncharacterized protein n=1 Tax=Rhizophora mucronata TaxID=61149 RepID=A0A2P2MK48_RHIMU
MFRSRETNKRSGQIYDFTAAFPSDFSFCFFPPIVWPTDPILLSS